MYGMVNKAVEEMVCRNHGEAVWEEVKRKAGVDVDVFMTNDGYPDDVTYRLVGAASEVLGMPVTVRLVEAKAQGADHDVFDVTWEPAASA